MSNVLKERRLEKNMTLEQVGDLIGVGKSTVRKWENGMIENMGRDKIVALSKALNISPLEILGMTDDDFEKDDITTIYNKLNVDRQQKLYSYAKKQLEEQSSIVDIESKRLVQGRSTAAGLPLNAECEDSNSFIANVNMKSIPHNVDEIVTVAGDSMEPVLEEGSTIFVRHQPEVENGEIAIVSIEDEGVTCKKVYLEDDKIKLVSYNEKYDDMFYPVDKIKIIGKVIK